MRFRHLFLISLLLAVVSATSGQQTNGGRIQGRVLRGQGNVAVPQATVTLIIPAAVGGPTAQRVVTADGSGRFEFSGLAPGTYPIQARANGYYFGVMGMVEERAMDTATLRATSLNANVTLRLNKAGVISGRLKDADGRPISNVDVAANHVEYRGGQPTLVTMQFTLLPTRGGVARTDERGEFRLSGLPTGEYYITAASGLHEELSRLTYYPGVTSPSLAQALAIADGAEITADFAMQLRTGFSVSGKVAVPLEVRGYRSTRLYLESRNTAMVQAHTSALTNRADAWSPDGAENTFEIRGLEDGVYELFAIVGDSPKTAVARIPFEVRGRDVEGLSGVAELPQTVKGRIVSRDPSLRVERNSPFLNAVPDMPSSVTAGMIPSSNRIVVSADGTFTIENVFPGTYLTGITGPLPSGGYVSDIRVGNRSIYPAKILSVGSGPVEPVTFTIDRGTTSVRGTVVGPQQQPVASVRVVLVPESPARQDIRRYRRLESTGSTGAFQFSSVEPGEYRIFAWEQSVGAREQDAAFIARIETFGQRVTVLPNTPLIGLRVEQIAR